MPNCQEVGILGAVAGTVGTIQAIETLKEILEIGDSLEDRLLIFNALKMTFDSVKVNKHPECHLCGENPSIKEVAEYKQPECDFENLPV